MYKELRKKAKKKVEAKKAFYICSIVFSFTIVTLLILSFAIPAARFWLLLPIPILIMVIGILYITAFGFPTKDGFSDNWEEEEIEREMIKLFRKKKAQISPQKELTETEFLELKELERLENKWYGAEDYV